MGEGTGRTMQWHWSGHDVMPECLANYDTVNCGCIMCHRVMAAMRGLSLVESAIVSHLVGRPAGPPVVAVGTLVIWSFDPPGMTGQSRLRPGLEFNETRWQLFARFFKFRTMPSVFVVNNE
jgi:hypothetical protein